MKFSTNDIKSIELLMNEYKFKQPIPLAFQEEILREKNQRYKKILKTLGLLSLAKLFALNIYFIIKKFTALSIVNKITIVALFTISTAAGAYFSLNLINKIITPHVVDFSIVPENVNLIGETKIEDIHVEAVLADKNKKDISADVKAEVTPSDLARIESNTGDQSLKIIFNRIGEGTAQFTLGNIIKSIHISYSDKIEKKTGLRLLYDKFKHTEIVYLKDGNVFKGVLRENGGNVNLLTEDGELTLHKDDIERVEYIVPK